MCTYVYSHVHLSIPIPILTHPASAYILIPMPYIPSYILIHIRILKLLYTHIQVRVDSMLKVAEIEEAEKNKMANKCKKNH